MKSRESYPDQFFTPHNKKKLQVAIAERITGLHGKDLTSADISDWAVEYSGNLEQVLASDVGVKIKRLIAHDDFDSAAEMALVELKKMDEQREKELSKFSLKKDKGENLSDVA